MNNPVDIIIPVYRGLSATQRCIESVLTAEQRTASEVVVINDATPEPAIQAYLEKLSRDKRITLLTHATNRGFVASVNAGMMLHPERDCTLLNSDCEVAHDWLDRLKACAERGPKIATVTPFSNHATIASYPRFPEHNELPEAWTTAELDQLFKQSNRQQAVEIPTAVGFCMYIKREALQAIGLFDIEHFERGYGEENDFSLRAAALGYKNLLCGDVFVYHQGEVSFGATAQEEKNRAQAVLDRLYPYYRALIAEHIARDPARQLRRRIDLARLSRSTKPRIVFVGHHWGGGVTKHIQDLSQLIESDCEVLLLKPSAKNGVELRWLRSDEECAVYFNFPDQQTDLIELLRSIGTTRLHYHHVHGLPQAVLRLPEFLDLAYDCTLHDYFPICPQYNLNTVQGRYCGEPDLAGCTACLAERPAQWGLSITAWRECFKLFLLRADRVIVPTQDVAQRMHRYFHDLKVQVIAHPDDRVRIRFSSPTSYRKILILGGLSKMKGLHLVEACAIDARDRHLPLSFRILGFTEEPIKQWPEVNLSIHGQYREEELLNLLAIERGDLILLPSQVPETYSYVLSAAMTSGLPILAARIGALVERLSDYPLAQFIDWQASPRQWNDVLLNVATQQQTARLPVHQIVG